MNKILNLIFIGSLSGFIGGLLGGGSDILIVPLLLILGSLYKYKNSNWNKFSITYSTNRYICSISILEKGKCGIKDSLVIALSFTLVSTLSANLGLKLNQNELKKYTVYF